jgi:hypothetical protein
MHHNAPIASLSYNEREVYHKNGDSNMSRQAADPSPNPPVVEVFADATITFERFLVPNFARVKDMRVNEGFSTQKLGAVPLSGLPEDVLDKLVGFLIEDIYAKAGRSLPEAFEKVGEE